MNDIRNLIIVVMTSIISVLIYVNKQLMDTNYLLARKNVEITEELFKMQKQLKQYIAIILN